tara:strand:+ start:2270 stop:2893 length:624 start_codon:yes stop_codon:yes gene_type:complete
MIVIAVCGGTGSGKSYLSKKIINQFNKYRVEYLCLDSYYKNYRDLSFAERCEINFDHPDSIDFELFYQHLKSLIDGNEIYCPVYSYKSHKRLSKNKKINVCDILIVDGIYILLKKNIRKLFDLSIFLDVEYDIRLDRRINRDIAERSRTKNEVVNRFEKMIIPMHKKFVEKTKDYADLKIKENYSFKAISANIEKLINEVYQNHKEF